MKPRHLLLPATARALAQPDAAAPGRRRLLAGAAAAAATLVVGAPRPARAQDAFPSKPIRLVVPFTPGGVTDTSGRVIAEFLGRRLGQQVVVDNKPGASGNIGTQIVATAPADGHTLLLGFDGTMVINPHVFAKVPFDTLKDFAPVGKIGDAVLILAANPTLPVRTLQELLALSKSQPGGLSYGTSGIGGTPHIAGELLRQRTGANLQHVPYKGGGQAITDTIGGTIPLTYTAVAGAQGHVKAGRLKAIAVSSAARASRGAHLHRERHRRLRRQLLGRPVRPGSHPARRGAAAQCRAQRRACRPRGARASGGARHRPDTGHPRAVPRGGAARPGALRPGRALGRDQGRVSVSGHGAAAAACRAASGAAAPGRVGRSAGDAPR
jgi:tripartite-type tricarboxylate transporter receptor subunit TctC